MTVMATVAGMPETPTGAHARMPSPWTVVFAALTAADGVFWFWNPTPIVIGLFVGLGAVAAFFHWRDQPKVPDA